MRIVLVVTILLASCAPAPTALTVKPLADRPGVADSDVVVMMRSRGSSMVTVWAAEKFTSIVEPGEYQVLAAVRKPCLIGLASADTTAGSASVVVEMRYIQDACTISDLMSVLGEGR